MHLAFSYFTDEALIYANLGYTYFVVNSFLQYLISFLFAIFISVFCYKYVKFSTFDKKGSSTSVFGTFLGILVAGCPACSLTVASYLGLTSLVVFLPYYGLELKFIAVIILLFTNYYSLKDLNTCKVKLKSK